MEKDPLLRVESRRSKARRHGPSRPWLSYDNFIVQLWWWCWCTQLLTCDRSKTFKIFSLFRLKRPHECIQKGLKHSHCLNSYKEEAKGISLTEMMDNSDDNDDKGECKDDMKPQISYCADSTSPIRPPLPSETGLNSCAYFVHMKSKVSCSVCQKIETDR